MRPPPVSRYEDDGEGEEEEEDEDSAGDHSMMPGKRKGMQRLPPKHRAPRSDPVTINVTPRRQRRRPREAVPSASRIDAVHSVKPLEKSTTPSPPPPPLLPSASSLRNMSLSTAFESLTLTSNMSQIHEQHKAAQPDMPSLSFLSQEEPQCPKTPSCIPKPVQKTPQLAAGLQLTVDHTPLTKYKVISPTPGRILYLNRDSNLVAPAWDTKGRLEDMEVLYSQLKSKLDSASTEKNGMEGSIEIYKTRSMSQLRSRRPLRTSKLTSRL